MSSARYSVVVSEQVNAVLQELHQSDRVKCRTLALLLLRLEKDPKPEGSRELRPDGEPCAGASACGSTGSSRSSIDSTSGRVWLKSAQSGTSGVDALALDTRPRTTPCHFPMTRPLAYALI